MPEVYYEKYVIGVDYGTLSGRAILVDALTGETVAESVFEYPHGVMSSSLPDGTPLSSMTALQHPQDYLDVLENTVPDVLKKSGVDKGDVAGVSIDFTSCTMLPLLADCLRIFFLRLMLWAQRVPRIMSRYPKTLRLTVCFMRNTVNCTIISEEGRMTL